MLLVIDVVVVTLWVILDPMQRHLQNLTLEISPQDRGVVYQPQVINTKPKTPTRFAIPGEIRGYGSNVTVALR